jgi:hypothetical protein
MFTPRITALSMRPACSYDAKAELRSFSGAASQYNHPGRGDDIRYRDSRHATIVGKFVSSNHRCVDQDSPRLNPTSGLSGDPNSRHHQTRGSQQQ